MGLVAVDAGNNTAVEIRIDGTPGVRLINHERRYMRAVGGRTADDGWSAAESRDARPSPGSPRLVHQ